MIEESTHNFFESVGDIEVAIIHENKDAFAGLINGELYEVHGTPPEQNIMFHTSATMELFYIRFFEMFSERDIVVPNVFNQKLSIFTGAKWITKKYENVTDTKEINKSIESIEHWLTGKNDFHIWDGNRHIDFSLTRRQMLKFSHLFAKHNLFSINEIFKTIIKQTFKKQPPVTMQEIAGMIDIFKEENNSRINYHSSYIIEMLHIYFTELNAFVRRLYPRPMNEKPYIICPEGTSDTFWNYHSTNLSFAYGYSKQHYDRLKPQTTKFLKMRY